ncbi:MAG TPA: DarT ssDNA thymidine ADP-ribosyltransferase family protein [Thermoanaerobaculia bacterium]
MALTAGAARSHIEHWTGALGNSRGRASWPAYLFHAAHVTTAVKILQSGRLSCRGRLDVIDHDVANQGALHHNLRAHDFARLYFRPRNAFHLKTEGIKCIGDPYRDRNHMSIPILFAFDAMEVLTRDGTAFSQGKLSRIREIGNDDAFFATIPFDDVYHDGPCRSDEGPRILDARMAEVVVPDRLPLAPYLRRIFCRTGLERRTLLHLLGADARRFRSLLASEPEYCSLFHRDGLYLKHAEFREGALELDFHHPRRDPGRDHYELKLMNRAAGQDPDIYSLKVPRSRVRVTTIRPSPDNCWEIHIEDVLAFHAPIPGETSVLLG